MTTMKDPKTGRYGQLLKRYLVEARTAGLKVSKFGEGWHVTTMTGMHRHCPSDSELISYLKGYLGR
jgi:hypothetical protein